MVLIHVFVKTKESIDNEFERNLREIVAEVRKMPGCTRYDWYRLPDSSLEYAVFGEFETRELFENYLNAGVVQRIGDELIPLLEAPPAFKHYEATVFDSN